MATVNLGAIKFNWKGAFNNSTAYAVDDVVSSGGSSYVCILASTGNAVSNGTYWELMSSAGTNGTNGTDVGTTLTTQGDILYRDGSGLQRLAKGTANQELRINSGATAPEWHTPAVASSEYVKIASNDISGTPTSINFTSIFTSDYRQYEVYISEFYCTSADELCFRYINSSNTVLSGSNYSSIGSQYSYNYVGNNSVETLILKSHLDTKIRIMEGHTTENNATHLNARITLYNPLSTSPNKTAILSSGSRSASNVAVNHNKTTWYYDSGNTSGFTGIQFLLLGSQTMANGKITIYGLK